SISTVMSIVIFALAAVLLAVGGDSRCGHLSVALWGVAFGGFLPPSRRSALSRLSGRAADVAQSMYTTG
ncbi:MFS transporter, partial [Serratia marcescens]|nr:MFS transporter [Serratia marcescens]